MALLLGFLGIDPNISPNQPQCIGRRAAAVSSIFEDYSLFPVIPGRREATNPESRDSQVRNGTP